MFCNSQITKNVKTVILKFFVNIDPSYYTLLSTFQYCKVL